MRGLVAGVVLGLGVAAVLRWPGVEAQATDMAALMRAEAATIALFEQARDGVVAISTSADRVNPLSGRRFSQGVGSGSGFFWDGEGHVVTNAHVLEGASAATVMLADGRSFPARLVGRDARHDLAVLKIEGEELPGPLPVGDSAGLRVGQAVLAIGNPFGLDWTLTTGIVSALDRELPEGRGVGLGGLIQTDAAINPGNSGGPLLDSMGRLIGVNTAIWSPSGASAGIGFAVPVGTVARVVPQLIDRGYYAPPSLGIVWDARINAAVNRMGLQGVMVLDVQPGTDAARAGLEPARLSREGRIVPGDVVVAVAGEAVGTVEELLAALDGFAAGEAVEVTFDGGGQRVVEVLTLVEG